VTQGEGKGVPLYAFFIRAEDILRIADISRIKRDGAGGLLGYQRDEVQHHVNEIVEYLNSQNVLFPNAIILAMSSAVRFGKSRGPQIGSTSCEAGHISIPLSSNGKRPAWIVDGQQRTLALMKSTRPDLLVPITAFVSDDFEVHRTQFLLVNKVKPLPSGLISELLPAVNTVLPSSLSKNKIPSALCDILDKDPESPFFGLVIRETTDRKSSATAVVTDNSLIHVIRSSLNSVHGCLYQYRNVATGEIDVDGVRATFNLFWQQVKETFPEAWGKDPKSSRLMGGVGIKAMGALMDRIMGSISASDANESDRIRVALKPLVGRCAWTEGNWELLNGLPWKHLQNTPSHVNLLSNMLIRVCSGMA
jgi:DGQHR domain-containing protein